MTSLGRLARTLARQTSEQWLARLGLWLPNRPAPKPDDDARVRPLRVEVPLRGGSHVDVQGHLWVLGRDAGPLASIDWHAPEEPRLVRYILNYHDFLLDSDAAEQGERNRDVLERWCALNPPTADVAWRPFPTAARIGNWLKWHWMGLGCLEGLLAGNLCVQAEVLSRRMERHLGAGHLLADGVALTLAGLGLEHARAPAWLAMGLGVLERELGRQILPDGGHVELSPMYQGLILGDLLDLRQVLGVADRPAGRAGERFAAVVARLDAVLPHMWRWLLVMTSLDGEPAHFNDSNADLTRPLGELRAAARRVGLSEVWPGPGLVRLEQSGYVRAKSGPFVLLADVAEVGYGPNPGHGHADTLSFECAVAGRRLLVNHGVSRYDKGPERLRERGTAAHNTPVVNGRDSSEVWASFRIGRGAHTFDVEASADGEVVTLRAAHDGYARQRWPVIVRREWVVAPTSLRVTDRIEGVARSVEIPYHLHPSVRLLGNDGGRYRLGLGSTTLLISSPDATLRLLPDSYAPSFYVEQTSHQLVALPRGPQATVEVKLAS